MNNSSRLERERGRETKRDREREVPSIQLSIYRNLNLVNLTSNNIHANEYYGVMMMSG
jgi:hypothetical protein